MAKATILPPTRKSLIKLSRIQGHDRCVLTVYFPGSPSEAGIDLEKLAELPETILHIADLTGDEAEHFRRSLDLWRAGLRNVSFPAAPAWVGVASWLTEDLAFVRLPATADPMACLDNSPFLFTAGRLLDDFEAYAVVYADHSRAIIYIASLGKLEEKENFRGEIKNHVKKGGWSQQRYERRRDREIHHYCKAVINKLGEIIETEGLRRIVLAGNTVILNDLERRMPDSMLKSVVCRLPMEDKGGDEIFRKTLPAAAEEEKREEVWLRNAILNEHAAGGKAVVGPVDTLAALEENRVRRLLIGPMEDVDFRRCKLCGTYGLELPDVCRKCGGETYAQSSANEFMDLAFSGGGHVEFTLEDLSEIDGVGALLRW